jgi:hypothetical protein
LRFSQIGSSAEAAPTVINARMKSSISTFPMATSLVSAFLMGRQLDNAKELGLVPFAFFRSINERADHTRDDFSVAFDPSRA